jgi:processive 1,2-diacylglycerol beta-glucosyltransferase
MGLGLRRRRKKPHAAAPAHQPLRVLVLSASAGAGHLRAGEAVEAACRMRFPGSEVRHVDALTLTPAPFRRMYSRGYLDFVARAPGLFGVLYEHTNRPPKNPAADKIRLALERLNTAAFVRFVKTFDPHVICHTHFLPAEIVGHERRKGRIAAPDTVVVTDFEVHRFWLCRGAGGYCVAREENRLHLEALGVPREQVRVTGIPIDPVFGLKPERAVLRKKHGIENGLPTVLVLCGGFGVGPMEALVKNLQGALTKARMVIVTGRNEALRERLSALARRAPTPMRVLGYTREMHELMALADLAVTKPGGLTTSEALAMGLPLVVANPIPGQETRNAIMLYEEGVAISGENPYTIGPRVARLLASPNRLGEMRRKALALARPEAAHVIAEDLGRMAVYLPDAGGETTLKT